MPRLCFVNAICPSKKDHFCDVEINVHVLSKPPVLYLVHPSKVFGCPMRTVTFPYNVCWQRRGDVRFTW